DDDTVAWFAGDGTGAFGTAQPVSLSATAVGSVSAVDFDGDGDTDVLSASAGDDKIAWYENTLGDGTAWARRLAD
ncbi:MAG: VCBS repeat-containing protein, partial [Actinobacteria bacterium]|nr:VCBS repeat-containing protein [Actinomycetota bacterium]NIS33418.1 VCBS repeat-containing protein [Actinomycetota bacterium]NIT96881.1 VCBS repeat-containing protein [Actinomycetota bacterium]NIU20555.1 VCBS repeat-containing protein [Actinomycetota bacterium]NIU68306.1 VCBS repeat-containing protein [Actinomycetota bacterium]